MIQRTIRVRASRSQVRRILRKLPDVASGKASGHGGTAQALLVRVGLAALGQVKNAFVVKARGGADASGLRWPPLSPRTVAYSRRHPGVLWPGKKRAPYAPSWMLTSAQRRRWWQVYRSIGGIAPQGAGFHRGGASQGYAAAMAWRVLKSEGAETLIGRYGNVRVEILRDRGFLLNSLSPGVVVGPSAPQRAPRVKNQVFQLGQGEVIIGTNRRFAATHHFGVPGRIPQRRLWPHPRRWPRSWWREVNEQAVLGVADIINFLLTGRRT